MKLGALVRDRLGDGADLEPAEFGRGAGAALATTGWVLVDERPARQLGAALAWAIRTPGVERLNVFADEGSGVLARRASQFDIPDRRLVRRRP